MLDKIKEFVGEHIAELLLVFLFVIHTFQEEERWALIPLVGMIIIGEFKKLR